MPGPYYVTVGTATPAVSGVFAIAGAHRALVVETASLAAGGEVRPEFSATSGGTMRPFYRPDGSGLLYTVSSTQNPAIGVIERPPSPWGRFTLTTSVTLITTFTLIEVRR